MDFKSKLFGYSLATSTKWIGFGSEFTAEVKADPGNLVPHKLTGAYNFSFTNFQIQNMVELTDTYSTATLSKLQNLSLLILKSFVPVNRNFSEISKNKGVC